MFIHAEINALHEVSCLLMLRIFRRPQLKCCRKQLAALCCRLYIFVSLCSLRICSGWRVGRDGVSDLIKCTAALLQSCIFGRGEVFSLSLSYIHLVGLKSTERGTERQEAPFSGGSFYLKTSISREKGFLGLGFFFNQA